MDQAISRLLVDLEAQSVIAGVDPAVSDVERGQLDGAVTILKVLARHGLTLTDDQSGDVWTASMAGAQR